MRHQLIENNVPDNKKYASDDVIFGNITLCRYVSEPNNSFFTVVREQKVHLEDKEIAIEEEMTSKAVKAIVDRVLEIGNGDPVAGSIKAVKDGILDSPMSPNIHVKDQVMGVRDAQGAVRYLDFGNLPIPQEVKAFHQEKVAERARIEGRKMNYQVVVEDFWAPSLGHLLGKPGKTK